MNKKKFTQVARNVIDVEIKGLQKLKKNIGSSFDKACLLYTSPSPRDS